MRLRKNLWGQLVLFLSLLFWGCKPGYNDLPAFSDSGNVQMIVEIPAGTNMKYEINPQTDEFELEMIDGKGRRVSFLPYPGNYGFIPSTLMDKSKGGDGDALDVILIAESIPQGTLVEIIPIGVLHLLDQSEKDDKIIAVPAKKDDWVIECETLSCMQANYPNAIKILEWWFTGYKGENQMEVQGWGDESEALEDINTWKK